MFLDREKNGLFRPDKSGWVFCTPDLGVAFYCYKTMTSFALNHRAIIEFNLIFERPLAKFRNKCLKA